MSKPHTGNHGIHKFRRPRYFGGGGIWFLLIALVIIVLWALGTFYILGGFQWLESIVRGAWFT